MTLEKFTHFDDKGQARQVDVTGKEITRRQATAEARLVMSEAVRSALMNGELAKGDALAVARVAGIQAAKQTAQLIPLCHPIPLGKTEIEINAGESEGEVIIHATTAANHITGVEMEALTAASVAALTIYDMIKSREKTAVIQQVRLLKKTGGKSDLNLA
jgi:cyclic pyranopterin phosphate synthase